MEIDLQHREGSACARRYANQKDTFQGIQVCANDWTLLFGWQGEDYSHVAPDCERDFVRKLGRIQGKKLVKLVGEYSPRDCYADKPSASRLDLNLG